MIKCDAPYMTGLSIKMGVDEVNEDGESVTRDIWSIGVDASKVGLKEMHACLEEEAWGIMTSSGYATKALRLFETLFYEYER